MGFSTNDTETRDKWIIEIVEKGSVGEYTSHVLESKDKVHIAYFDYINGDLKHAKSGPDGWIIERVDQEGTVGQYLSIAKDEGGNIYISYNDHGKNRLKMAVFDGNRWNFEVVDYEPFASLDTSIFVDAPGKVYISYYNFNLGYLKLAVRDMCTPSGYIRAIVPIGLCEQSVESGGAPADPAIGTDPFGHAFIG